MNDLDFEPTAADLADVSDLAAEVEAEEIDWESLLPAPIVSVEDDEDDSPWHDDRYDGTGIPSWSAWA